MLASVRLITSDECYQIVQCLLEIEAEIQSGLFSFKPELEDVHMNIEAAVIEKIGDIGRKLHTARSRNDQVATDIKLWARDALDRIDKRLTDLQAALVKITTRYPDLILPGYIHMQRAQPILSNRLLLAYVQTTTRPIAAGRLPSASERVTPRCRCFSRH